MPFLYNPCQQRIVINLSNLEVFAVGSHFLKPCFTKQSKRYDCSKSVVKYGSYYRLSPKIALWIGTQDCSTSFKFIAHNVINEGIPRTAKMDAATLEIENEVRQLAMKAMG